MRKRKHATVRKHTIASALKKFPIKLYVFMLKTWQQPPFYLPVMFQITAKCREQLEGIREFRLWEDTHYTVPLYLSQNPPRPKWTDCFLLTLHFLRFTDTLRPGLFSPPLISFSLHVVLHTRACYSVPVRWRLMVMPIDFVCRQKQKLAHTDTYKESS